jgi:hypothetical protein
LTATSPDDVMMTSPNPGPLDDVMLTSSKEHANKAKKPYFRYFSQIRHIFRNFAVELFACNSRRPLPASLQPNSKNPARETNCILHSTPLFTRYLSFVLPRTGFSPISCKNHHISHFN